MEVDGDAGRFHSGDICTGETYKSVVKLTFSKGASLKDPSGLFNSSLDGKSGAPSTSTRTTRWTSRAEGPRSSSLGVESQEQEGTRLSRVRFASPTPD